MTLKTKINIDKILGFPVVLILNFICLLFRRKNVSRKDVIKNILICKFMGMGSIIQSTPLMITLKNNYPDAQITFLTVNKNYELLGLFPFVNKILTIDESSVLRLILSTLHTFSYLLINRIDIFIDLEIYSFFSKIFVPLSLAKYRIGFFRIGSKILSGIYSNVLLFNSDAPVKNVYLEIAALVQCKLMHEDLFDYKNVLYGANNSLNQNIFQNFNNGDYIVINPNASELRIERRWPAEDYIFLINQIMDLYPGINVYLTGSSEEKKYVAGIINGILEKHRCKVINTSGQLGLSELIGLIDQSRFMITNDSGPMHIAFALKKMTIALFGPCSPIGYINQNNVEFIYKKIHCSPCVHDYLMPPCRGNNQCMKLINVAEVMEKVNRIMEKDLTVLLPSY
jgi:ADP-heptose:LPS heptosyltransferase